MTRKNEDAKIVYFPGLEDRLLEKGMAALKNGQAQTAKDAFLQLESLDSDLYEAKYGLAMCYVDLEEHEKALEITEQLLGETIDHYPEVLKLHLTILVQLKHYNEVMEMVDIILEEENLSVELRQNLQNIAYFARKRSKEKPAAKAALNHDQVEKLTAGLYERDPEKQSAAIQEILRTLTPDLFPSLYEYLESDHGDPFLKTLVLKELKDAGAEPGVTIKKFGQSVEIDLSNPLNIYSDFTVEVANLMDQALESDNPTLQSQAQHVWGHVVISIFPLTYQPDDANIWAGACLTYVNSLNGMKTDHSWLQETFNVSGFELSKVVDVITKIEESPIKSL